MSTKKKRNNFLPCKYITRDNFLPDRTVVRYGDVPMVILFTDDVWVFENHESMDCVYAVRLA